MAQTKKTGNDKIKTVNTRTVERVKNPKAKKNKTWTVLSIVGCTLAALILIYCVVDLSTPLIFKDFYADAEKSVKIPGLSEAFVPQGFAYSEELSSYLISGYMSNSEQSRIYIVTMDGESREIRLKNEDGSNFTGHAGGISCNKDDVYISNDKKVYYLSLETLKNAKDLESVRFEGRFDVPCRASFTFCDEEMLWVGEFYHDGYNTDPTHKIETSDGEHNAFVFGYKLDENGAFGVADVETPDIIYSVCNKVQGMAITEDGRAVLSISYGLSNSELKIYNPAAATKLEYDLEGKTIPLYVLDSGCMEKNVTMPWGSEDIDVQGGKVIIGFEFGSTKYGGGLLPFAIENIMLYTVEK